MSSTSSTGPWSDTAAPSDVCCMGSTTRRSQRGKRSKLRRGLPCCCRHSHSGESWLPWDPRQPARCKSRSPPCYRTRTGLGQRGWFPGPRLVAPAVGTLTYITRNPAATDSTRPATRVTGIHLQAPNDLTPRLQAAGRRAGPLLSVCPPGCESRWAGSSSASAVSASPAPRGTQLPARALRSPAKRTGSSDLRSAAIWASSASNTVSAPAPLAPPPSSTRSAPC
jgi:hypothetical protein